MEPMWSFNPMVTGLYFYPVAKKRSILPLSRYSTLKIWHGKRDLNYVKYIQYFILTKTLYKWIKLSTPATTRVCGKGPSAILLKLILATSAPPQAGMITLLLFFYVLYGSNFDFEFSAFTLLNNATYCGITRLKSFIF
jgi:hypothetical protein